MQYSALRSGKINFIIFKAIFILFALLLYNSTFYGAELVKAKTVIDSEALLQQGIHAYNRGVFEESVQYMRSAILQFKAESDERRLASAYLYLSNSFQELGLFKEAIDTLIEALSLTQKIGDEAQQIKVMTNLGQVYILTGNEGEAVKYITKSANMTNKNADPVLRAAVLNNLANLFESQKKYDQAITAYRDVATLAGQVNNNELVAKAQVNLARVFIRQQEINQAAEELKKSLPTALSLADNHEKAAVLIQFGLLSSKIYKELKKTVSEKAESEILAQAYNALAAASETAGKINDLRAASYAHGYLGGIYEIEGRYDESLRHTRQAVFTAQQAQAPSILYLWQWQTGRILQAQQNIDGAISAYKRALQSLEAIKKDLAEECHSNIRNRQSYQQTVGPIYFSLADLLLRRGAAEHNPEQRQQDLLLARETIEGLKTVEIQDYFQDDCVTAYLSQTVILDELAADTAIVYPIILPHRLEILVSFKRGIKQYTVPVDGRKVIAEVRSLRKNIEKPGNPYLQHATKLYDWLIRPFEKDLVNQNIKLLTFVLDRALRSIPMSVLNDGDRFLVQKYGLSTTLGLTLTDPHPLDRKNVQILLNGLTEGVQGFPPLPSVQEELSSINEDFSGRLLLNKDFTKANMQEALLRQSYSIIHIASHGQFDSDPDNTFLLTYDDKMTMEELTRFLEPSRFREEPVELLTLSACQTAIGDDRAALGLAGVAIKAGARSALASLWFVDDTATAKLMEDFYKNLEKSSTSKVQALQEAQLALLKEKKFQHPAFWAPFILIGNWL